MKNAEADAFLIRLGQAAREPLGYVGGITGGSIIAAITHLIQHNFPAAGADVTVGLIGTLTTREGREIDKEIFTGFINLFKPKVRT